MYCKQCNQGFEITDKDRDFYKKMDVPEPTWCPECRLQRRLAWRNERYLYKRKCDLTDKEIITVYSPDKPYKVYDHETWWGDDWNPLEHGLTFDFSRPFFEQFEELMRKVPRMNMMLTHCENSEYAPYSFESRNIYMSNSIVESEDILYSYQTNHSKNCVDCTLCYGCELCYECVYGVNLYHCFWTQNCCDSADIFFCRDCQGCKKCIGCVNLAQKELHIFNKPVSNEEYEDFLQRLNSAQAIEQLKSESANFFLQLPYRADHNIQVENCVGDHLIKSKNSKYCFEAEELEDCAYIYTLPSGAKDIYDAHYAPKAELVYEAMSACYGFNAKFINHSWNIRNSYYTDFCFYSSDLFGCISLKKNHHCILNKQYSKEEYEGLVPKIIEHMKSEGEWGEFFPISISPFGYNETLAQECFSLNKEEVLANNWNWCDYEMSPAKADKTIPASRLPDNIDSIPDDILNWAIRCEATEIPYKIIPHELKFYREMKLPVPHLHPNERYKERAKIRSARKLFDRKCDKCQSDIKTTYSSDRPEKVYCEQCYLKEVY